MAQLFGITRLKVYRASLFKTDSEPNDKYLLGYSVYWSIFIAFQITALLNYSSSK